MLRTMSLGTIRIYRPLLIAAAMVMLAIALAGPAGVGAQEGQLAVDCDGTGSQVVAGCQYGEQQAFTVAIHAVVAPAAGYPAFQAKLRWDGAVLDYRPSDQPDGEAVWPACGISARFDNRPGDTSVLLGCASFPIEESNYAGALLQLDFACIAPGTSQLTLVAREGDAQDGSHFIALDDADAQIIIDPTLMGATVTCGGVDVDTPTPEPTAAPGVATSTPVPGMTEEPSDTSETMETETVVALPTTGVVDGADSAGNSLIPWLLLAAAVVAGTGGVGFLAWQRIARQ